MLAWGPDLDHATPELLTEVDNLLPTTRGYAGVPSAMSAGFAALGAANNGAALVLKLDGSTRLFAGTSAALYEGSGGTWTDRSRAGAPAYATGGVRWRFAQFGDTSLAINKATKLQVSSTAAFADAAVAPKASCIETVNGFVMVADTDDTGTGLATGYGDTPHRWWCSAYADHTSWAPSVTTQATSGLLIDTPGPIKALKRLGRDCVAYKERSLYIGRYAGPPVTWQWDLIPGEIGCSSVDAVVSVGFAHLFPGYEDFYLFDGSRPISIGEGIREWFFARLNKSYRYAIQGLLDYQNRLAIWWYPSGATSALNDAIVYHYPTRRWGHFTRTAESAVDVVIGGTTYDNLGASYSTYDDLPSIAYDSPFWQANAPVPSYFDGAHVIQTLTGNSASSSLVTGYVGDTERWSMITRVRPTYASGKKPTSAVLTPQWTTARGDAFTAGASSSVTTGDRFDVRETGRWHKLGCVFSGPAEIIGLQPTLRPLGIE